MPVVIALPEQNLVTLFCYQNVKENISLANELLNLDSLKLLLNINIISHSDILLSS